MVFLSLGAEVDEAVRFALSDYSEFVRWLLLMADEGRVFVTYLGPDHLWRA